MRWVCGGRHYESRESCDCCNMLPWAVLPTHAPSQLRNFWNASRYTTINYSRANISVIGSRGRPLTPPRHSVFDFSRSILTKCSPPLPCPCRYNERNDEAAQARGNYICDRHPAATSALLFAGVSDMLLKREMSFTLEGDACSGFEMPSTIWFVLRPVDGD
jgi:hypothetical protein